MVNGSAPLNILQLVTLQEEGIYINKKIDQQVISLETRQKLFEVL